MGSVPCRQQDTTARTRLSYDRTASSCPATLVTRAHPETVRVWARRPSGRRAERAAHLPSEVEILVRPGLSAEGRSVADELAPGMPYYPASVANRTSHCHAIGGPLS